MSGLFEKGEESSTATRQVDIPAFLRPFVTQAANTGAGALRSLQQLMGGDLVADFTPDQQAAFQRIRELSDNLPGQGTLEDAAGGVGLDFLPESVRSGLSQFGGLSFLPSFTRDTLSAGTSVPKELIETALGSEAARLLSGISRGGGIPTTATDELGRVFSGEVIPAASREALTEAASGAFTPEQLDTLRRTAGGDFLFGGEGFDQAVQAAVRAAQPGILSTFGSAGVGGGTGALSQAAIGRAATDAFAQQFGQERGRQLGAAETLANLDFTRQGQRLGAAETLAGLNLSDRGQRIGAADILGRLGLSGEGLRADAASDLLGRQIQTGGILADLGLSERGQDIQSAGLLGDFAAGAEGRSLDATGLLARLSDAERARQLQAAGELPGREFAGIEQLLGIGGLQQQLEQQRLSAPFQQQLQLLAAALGVPGSFSSLFGDTQTGESESRGFSLGFGD